ncbi:MAG TPA: GTPase HflX [Planctomycetota bacterium]|nr:GTPase HflX [Planctomycetota bacterium]
MPRSPKPTDTGKTPVVLVLTVPPAERELEDEREAEMRSLLDTAGRRVVAIVTQHLPKPVGATYIGTGKVEEVGAAIAEHEAQEVVFDVQLSPRQLRNLETELKLGVIDYNDLILAIFARNARTAQAMLAVELAQLQYARSRLRRLWTHLDRQALGGSGGASGAGAAGAVRGPGEKQIELDKRQVRDRIIELQDKLNEIESRKDRAVAGRSEAFNIALVGYTNAGKSTLMNALTKAGVLAEDRLFATLDTRTARLRIDGCPNVVLSDTVGFIRNLPPTLIASFHATLAEVREADLLLHVIDASSPMMDEQIEAVDGVLKAIDAGDIPTLMVFNKVDQVYSKTILLAYRRRCRNSVMVAALTGLGLDDLRSAIRGHIASLMRQVQVRFPATNGALNAFLRSRATITDERYEDDQALLTFDADERLISELRTHPDLVITG